MKSKNIVLEAIEHYDIYTSGQRKILKILVELAVEDIAVVTVKKLGLLSNLSMPVIYKALSIFEGERVITQLKKNGTKLTSFILNPSKLDEIVEYHKLSTSY